MAERRMFSKSIIDSDAFLSMPFSTQALYFHLCMRADDDGFINSPRAIQKMTGANDDDFKLLLAKRFVLLFESGVIVIKHWRIHNYIQKDRYQATKYEEEKSKLGIKKNKAYTLLSDNEACTPLDVEKEAQKALPSRKKENVVEEDVPQEDIDFFDSLRNDSIENPTKTAIKISKTTDKRSLVSVLDECGIEGELRDAFMEFVAMRDKKKHPLTQRALQGVITKLNKISSDYNMQVKILDQSLEHSWDTVYELKSDKRVGANNVRLSTVEDHTLDGIL